MWRSLSALYINHSVACLGAFIQPDLGLASKVLWEMCSSAAVLPASNSELSLHGHDSHHRLWPSVTVQRWGLKEDVKGRPTALHSRTAGRCAGRGSPQSAWARGSETTAASGSLSQGALFSWLGFCELGGEQDKERWMNYIRQQDFCFCWDNIDLEVSIMITNTYFVVLRPYQLTHL